MLLPWDRVQLKDGTMGIVAPSQDRVRLPNGVTLRDEGHVKLLVPHHHPRMREHGYRSLRRVATDDVTFLHHAKDAGLTCHHWWAEGVQPHEHEALGTTHGAQVKRVCGAPATHHNGNHTQHYCREHARADFGHLPMPGVE